MTLLWIADLDPSSSHSIPTKPNSLNFTLAAHLHKCPATRLRRRPAPAPPLDTTITAGSHLPPVVPDPPPTHCARRICARAAFIVNHMFREKDTIGALTCSQPPRSGPRLNCCFPTQCQDLRKVLSLTSGSCDIPAFSTLPILDHI